LTGGLVNVSQREVMRKWTNMKFTCKAKGVPHPLLRAEQLDINDVAKKLKLCQVGTSDADSLKLLRPVFKENDSWVYNIKLGRTRTA
jgi:hypothetical protein